MAFKFNPFTGTLDQTGSGGGASYIDGEVQNFSALPETIGTPAVDSAYLVREAEGTWLLARKPAGIYIRTADTGVRAADWTHASAFPDVFSDAAFTVFSDGDSTKNLQLSLSGITTGTTRTLTAPNKSGTIALTTDIPSVNDIELETDGTTTITTAQLPARGIAYAPEGESTYTVNLPTPDIRQSGLTFSLKTEYEEGTGTVFVTVVHAAVNLLTTYELDEDEGSIDFVWDGYAWRYDTAYLLRSFPSRVLQLPAASGTIALTSDFAAPPAIGSTTPNTGAFTTLSANNGTLTASAPVLDLSQTWNNAGVTFTGLRVNVTNTASGSSSLLADFQVNGTSVLEVNSRGLTKVRKVSNITEYVNIFEVFKASSSFFQIRDDGNYTFPSVKGGALATLKTVAKSDGFFLASGGQLGWKSSAIDGYNVAPDLSIVRDAADTLAQRRTTNPQVFRIYNTYTDASNHERGFMRWSSNVLQIGTEKGSVGGSARPIGINVGSIEAIAIAINGEVTVRSRIYISTGSKDVAYTGLGSHAFSSVGTFSIRPWSGSACRINIGGDTSSFPALKRDTTTLQVKLADDSAFTAIQGKLTTETAYTAGAPTATGYLVLYDSNGTAYKVPAEAL
jgi:hypothetical protein